MPYHPNFPAAFRRLRLAHAALLTAKHQDVCVIP